MCFSLLSWKCNVSAKHQLDQKNPTCEMSWIRKDLCPTPGQGCSAGGAEGTEVLLSRDMGSPQTVLGALPPISSQEQLC